MSTEATEINIKEYDTLALVCVYQDDSGTPISLDDVAVTADIQSTSNDLYESLDVTKNTGIGNFTLTRDKPYLPFGQYRIDVLFSSEYVQHRVASKTFLLNVDHAITLPKV